MSATYTSIRLTRISLALKRSRSKAVMPAQAMPPMHAGQQDGTTIQRPGVLAGQQRDAAGRDRADHELAFGADVPDVGAEAHGQPQRDEQQRRGLDHQLADARSRDLIGSQKNTCRPAHRVLAQRHEQQHADQHGDRQRQQRRSELQKEDSGRGSSFKLLSWLAPSPAPQAAHPLHHPPDHPLANLHRRLGARHATATAAPWRSRAAGRRSRTAPRAPR
jgi:hypothetical protein